jgi:pyruvate carboxylase
VLNGRPAFSYRPGLDAEPVDFEALRAKLVEKIEPGKVLFIKRVHLAEPDRRGMRALTFELNGVP